MSNFPSWALQHRKPGTELRKIKGHYYLYSISSRWDKATKKTKKTTGPIIGKINPDGVLVPSIRRDGKREEKLTRDPLELTHTISTKEFGLSHFFLVHMKDIVEQLKNCFPVHWPYILAAAYCRLLRHSPINMMPLYIYHSYLSEELPGAKFTDKNIALALRDVGRDRQQTVRFLKWDVPDGEHVLIDLTHLPSRSRNAAFAQPGHKDFNGQINMLYIFGNQSLRPIFYRIVPGNIRDLSAFVLTMEESGIKGCILIMDKGFYSVKNTGYLAKKRFMFICPLKRDSLLVTNEHRSDLFAKGQANFFEYMGRIIWYVEIQPKDKGKLIYLYLNDERRNIEENDFIVRATKNSKEMDMAKFIKKKLQFGTLSLLTNMKEKTAGEIYQIYKTRNQIEVMYDGFKGVLEADKTYMQNKETLQGWMLANHIALLAHHRIYQRLLESGAIHKHSVGAIIERLALVSKGKINGKLVDNEVVKSSTALFQVIGIPVP